MNMGDCVFPVIKTYGRRRTRRGSLCHNNRNVNSIFQGRTARNVFQDSPVARSNVWGTGFGLCKRQRSCGLRVDCKANKLEITPSTTSGTEICAADMSSMIVECLGESVVEGGYVSSVYNSQDFTSQGDNQGSECSDKGTDPIDQSDTAYMDQTTSEDISCEDSESSIEILRKQVDPVKPCAVQSPLHFLPISQVSKSRRDLPICSGQKNLFTRKPFCSSFLPGEQSSGIELCKLDLSPIVQAPGKNTNCLFKEPDRVESLQNELEKTPVPLHRLNSATAPHKLSKFRTSKNRQETKKTKTACSTVLIASNYNDLENFFPCMSNVEDNEELNSQMGIGQFSETFSVELDLTKNLHKQQPNGVVSSSPCQPKRRKRQLNKSSGKLDLFHNDLSSIRQVASTSDDLVQHLGQQKSSAVMSNTQCVPREQKMVVSEAGNCKPPDLCHNDLSSVRQVNPTAVEDRDASHIPAVHPDLRDLTPPTEPVLLDSLCPPITGTAASDATRSKNLCENTLKQKKVKDSPREQVPLDSLLGTIKDPAITTSDNKQRAPDNLHTMMSKPKKSAPVQGSENNFAAIKMVPRTGKKTKGTAAEKRKAAPLCSIIALNKCCANNCQVTTYKTSLSAKYGSFPCDVLLQDFKVRIKNL